MATLFTISQNQSCSFIMNRYDTLQLSVIICSMIVVFTTTLLVRRRASLTLPKGEPCLSDPSASVKFKLVDRRKISSTVYVLRFSLPGESQVLGLPIGRHITISAMVRNPLIGDEEKLVSRQYTPISSDYADTGYFDLLIKVYRKNENPRFPEGGWMSQHLECLPVGTYVDCRGPCGRIEYIEHGRFKLGNFKLGFRRVGMIAGGTGITPMYQLIKHVLRLTYMVRLS